jgi:iron complex transport system substrate-binding protein
LKRFVIIFVFFIILQTVQVFSVYAAAPRRIVSLAPNLTEILFALGLGDRVAGVTTFCDYPEEARKKPKVGGMSNPSLEAVISLKPDVVILTTDGNQKESEERLRSLHIPTYVFRARRISELPQGIRDIGSALGAKEQAEILAAQIEKAMKDFRPAGRNAGAKKAIFIIWPEPLIAAGPETEIDDAMGIAGLNNIASGAVTSYPKYSIEEIIRQAPDIIIIGKGHNDVRKKSSGLLSRLKNVPAVINNRICYVSDNLYRLGPRVISGMKELSGCLR